MMQNSSKRINFFIFIVFSIFSLILLRLFYLQILHGKEYKSQGEDQYFFTTGDNFNRGAINFTDKNGNMHYAKTFEEHIQNKQRYLSN